MRRLGPYSQASGLAKLDGRTREAKLLKLVTRELVQHVGGNPSAVQSALIGQLAQIRLRIAAMDRKAAEAGDMTAHDSRQYLAWANTHSRLLRQLGLKAAAVTERSRSLSEYLANRPGDHPTSEADTPMHP